MPAAKKHDSTRARRNTSSTRALLPAVVKRNGPTPNLPQHDWHAMVLEWWGDLWRSPMSAEYHDSDLHQLFMLATLYDDFYKVEPGTVRRAQLAAEIRQQRSSFGLTPYDRRRLEWTIEQVDEAQDRGRRRRQAQPAKPVAPADDPRQALRVV